MTRWALLSGEFPPMHGGVADYTLSVARGLVEAGDRVTVFAPGDGGTGRPDGVDTRCLPDRFGVRSLRVLNEEIGRSLHVDRVLVEYVPHAFGMKALNIPLTTWLSSAVPARAALDVMFHEVSFPFSWRPWTHAVLGTGTALMARSLVRAADRTFIAAQAWEERLRRLHPTMRQPVWLPVPSNVACDAPASEVQAIREKTAAGVRVVGHFGTYGHAIAGLLKPALVDLLVRAPHVEVLLMGQHSERFCNTFSDVREYQKRVRSTGRLSASDLAAHIRACDVMLQPYPDGITTRRGTAMACLANGAPVVSNVGFLSEPFWAASNALHIAESADSHTLAQAVIDVLDSPGRIALGQQGAALYSSTFTLDATIQALRHGL